MTQRLCEAGQQVQGPRTPEPGVSSLRCELRGQKIFIAIGSLVPRKTSCLLTSGLSQLGYGPPCVTLTPLLCPTTKAGTRPVQKEADTPVCSLVVVELQQTQPQFWGMCN